MEKKSTVAKQSVVGYKLSNKLNARFAKMRYNTLKLHIMIVFIDTNLVLDVMLENADFYEESFDNSICGRS